MIDLNATQAAIRAGYSEKSAKQIGAENLTKPDLKIYIDEQLKKIESEKIADATEVMQYLTSVMRNEAEGEEVVVEFIGDGYSEARKVKKKPSEKEKLKAAELLGKRYGIFTDKVDIAADTELTIHVDYGDDAE